MDYRDKLDTLLDKMIKEYMSIIRQYEKGHSDVDYSNLFEEFMFLKLLSLDDCINYDRFNSIIEYFLSNDYTVNRLW